MLMYQKGSDQGILVSQAQVKVLEIAGWTKKVGKSVLGVGGSVVEVVKEVVKPVVKKVETAKVANSTATQKPTIVPKATK